MPISQIEKKIKDFLVEKNLISLNRLSEIEDIAKKSNDSLEDILIQQKIFSAKDFNQLKGRIFNVPAAELSEETIDQKVLNILDQKVSQNYQMVIFAREGETLKVGMVNPGDFKAHEAVEFLAGQQGLKTKYFSISLADFRSASGQYQGFNKEITSAMASAKEKFAEKEEVLGLVRGGGDMGEIIKSAPVAKIVSVIIKHAIDGGASDIHIEPGANEGRVRYRVDGMLHSTITLPNYLYAAVVSRIKVMANLKLDETRLPQDGRIRADIDGQDIDLRVSVLPTLDVEKVAIRVLDTSAGVPSLAELGYSPYHIEKIERNMKKPFGLFLLTGPTGSGKTTTLYAILNILNADEQNITTLEDPIEYYISGVNQSQINTEIGYTFASGLRAILRQDPNIIMVGEIRDNETVELVIHASLTGHLVFSTLHTNNAWGAIPRLIDMKAEPFLLSSIFNLVMSQRLVRKVCPNCREEMKLSQKAKERVDGEIKKIPPVFLAEFKDKYVFYRGQGCASCANTGYLGRTVVGEILEIDSDFKDLIARNYTFKEVEELMKKQNYLSLTQDGIVKALKGLTTVEEVIRVSQDQ
ncbi:MAG: GspE/PulE family protein [Patescibacteria group bacterium]